MVVKTRFFLMESAFTTIFACFWMSIFTFFIFAKKNLANFFAMLIPALFFEFAKANVIMIALEIFSVF